VSPSPQHTAWPTLLSVMIPQVPPSAPAPPEPVWWRVAAGLQGWYKGRGRVESTPVEATQRENEAMPVVRVILREGQEKVYQDAQVSIHTPDRTLRITRNQDSIAEFQSEYYQY
jgi:hypothetical protein